jgi:molybdopterin-containing oxidoreductase family iron-sulfur binding subunit
MNSNRRYLLKIAGLTTFALAGGLGFTAAARVAPASAKAGGGTYSADENALQAKRFVMAIDTRRFNAPDLRRKVVDACRRAHNVPSIPGPREVKWIWDEAFKHVLADYAGFLPEDAEDRHCFLLCNHCANPPCVRVCPAGATYLTEQGLVAIDYHRCVGCRFCMAACPYGSRSFNFQDPRPFLDEINAAYPTRMRGVVEKCTFCAERLEKGQMPACVEASDGAILFGDAADPGSSVRRALAQRFSVRRRPDLGTDPGVYYLI